MPGSGWKLRAIGGSAGMVADIAEVRRALELFADPELGCELMALRSGIHRTLPGSDLDGLCAAVGNLPSGSGVYFRINPVASGRQATANNVDIVKRRWVYIDVDPVKPVEAKDTSATDAEKLKAKSVCDRVLAHLDGVSWPRPVVVDSGNGYGLFYRCELPNDTIVAAHLRQLLKSLAEHFGGSDGLIDKSVHNANRLVKVPGTWARKGIHTEERPHRPSRLIEVPSTLGILDLGMLERAAGGKAQQPKPTPKPSKNGTHHGNAKNNYLNTAIDAECERVITAGADGRNNMLNRAAFSLGQLVGSGELDRDEIETRLFESACRSGLDTDPGCGERGIWATIRSGLESGMKEPRTVPEKPTDPEVKFPPHRDTLIAGVKAGTHRLTVPLTAIRPLRVSWLVPHRIPRRFITIFAGRTGVGKSFVAFDLIARLSAGGEIPGAGGECFEPGGTLIISEDSHEFVIAPRLITMGADLSRINAMTWEAMGSYFLGDVDMLQAACDEVVGGVKLVLIDPPTNFLGDVDEHRNSEVRQLVMKVVEWCFRHDLACVFVLHVNKQTGKGLEAINRVMGSVAWVSTSRIAHTFCLDPDDKTRGLWMPTKSNLGPLPKGLAYRIVGASDEGRLEWLGEVDITADDAMGGEPKARRRVVVATDWLIERFRERRDWASDELFASARAAGLSRNALFEAKDSLQLPKARQEVLENGDRQWVWWVPDDWPPLSRPSS